MVNDIWLEFESGKNNILDLSGLMENENVFMDSLENYLFFEQHGRDLHVYIDEKGGFSEMSFDLSKASEVVLLHNTQMYSDDFNDIVKQLLKNGQILMGYD
jgi:hypothetical protein